MLFVSILEYNWIQIFGRRFENEKRMAIMVILKCTTLLKLFHWNFDRYIFIDEKNL